MKLSGVSIFLLIVLGLIILQSLGGYRQIQDYKKAVRRVHQLGNVGMGQKRGRFFDGHIAIIACDNDGIITGAEALDGSGVLSRFHAVDTFMGEPLVGSSVFDLLEKTEGLDKKEWKRWQGYIRALEALEVRLTDRDLTREQEAYMETRRGKKGRRLR
jgi:DNA-binding transcriptional regulator of glucitol operon